MRISGGNVATALRGPLGWVAVVGVAGVAIYVLYRYVKSKFPNGVPNPLAPVGNSVGSSVYDFLHPNDGVQSSTLTPALPDGSHIAVSSDNIAPSGQFQDSKGNWYQLGGGDGNPRTATPIPDPNGNLSGVDSGAIDFSAGNF